MKCFMKVLCLHSLLKTLFTASLYTSSDQARSKEKDCEDEKGEESKGWLLVRKGRILR